jgi:hypothetical protein
MGIMVSIPFLGIGCNRKERKGMNKMLICILFTMLILIWPVAVMAQNLTPYQSLAFAQVAAGGGIESFINLTNRGTSNYIGMLSLFTGTNQPWSPTVNGTPITNGQYSFAISPGGTVTIDITSTAGTVSGFAQVTSTATSANALVEGTLTYYIKSGNTVLDSIGVAPSSELHGTSIPFDNFNNIALALANLNPNGIIVHMKLYSNANQLMGTFDQQLQNMQQVPKYLSQLFPSVTMTQGRLDLQSDDYFIGTALTQVAGGQYSSLPLLPAAKTYTYTRTEGTDVMTGVVYLFTEGRSFQGYGKDLTSNGQPVNDPLGYFQGHMASNGLAFYNTGQYQGQDYIMYFEINPFSLSMQNASGVWYAIVTSPGSMGPVGTVGAQGTLRITATN